MRAARWAIPCLFSFAWIAACAEPELEDGSETAGSAGSAQAGSAGSSSGSAGKSGSAQAGSAQAGSAQAGSAQAGSAQAGSAQAGSAQAGSAQAGSAQAGQAGSAQAGSAQAGSAQAGSAQAGSAQAGSAQAGSAQAGSAQAGAGGSATGLDPDLEVPASGTPCSSPGSLSECPGIEVCRISSPDGGTCESCDQCGNLHAFCSSGTDCDILFECYKGRCTNFCTLGSSECGAPGNCIDVGHATKGVCK